MRLPGWPGWGDGPPGRAVPPARRLPCWPPPPPPPCCAAFIIFLYLLLLFWNQIFTCKRKSRSLLDLKLDVQGKKNENKIQKFHYTLHKTYLKHKIFDYFKILAEISISNLVNIMIQPSRFWFYLNNESNFVFQSCKILERINGEEWER